MSPLYLGPEVRDLRKQRLKAGGGVKAGEVSWRLEENKHP